MAASRWFGQLQAAREHLTRSGVGFEIRDLRRDVEAAFQSLEANISGNLGEPCPYTALFIDPVNGLDTNNGTSALTPLKTWAQLVALIGLTPYLNSPLTVTIQGGNIPITDPVILRPVCGIGGGFILQGTLTLIYSGTFTAVTPRNPALNSDTLTCLSITDSAHAASWAADVGRLLKITGGTVGNIGAGMFVSKDLGSNACRLSSAIKPAVTGFVNSTEVVPVVGDSYEVYTMTEIAYADILVCRSAQSISVVSALSLVQNIRFNSGGASSNKFLGDRNVSTEFLNCRFSTPTLITAVRMHNCCFDGTHSMTLYTQGLGANNPYSLFVFGGVCIGRSFGMGLVSFNNGFYVQGSTIGSLISGPGLNGQVVDAGVMDWGGSILYAVQLQQGSIINGGQAGNTMKLWGYSATANTYGVRVSGGKFHCNTPTNITLKGALTATQDFLVDNRGTLPPFDHAASPPQYKAAINCTWALFNTTVAGGGFGGNAINPATGNGIVTEG